MDLENSNLLDNDHLKNCTVDGRTASIDRLIEEDVATRRSEYVFEAPAFVRRFFEPHLKDSRDIVMLHLMWSSTVLLLPSAALLFCLEATSYWFLPAAVCYIALVAFLYEKISVWMHFSSHRPTYKTTLPLAPFFNSFAQLISAPFIGILPGIYHIHHCIIHHGGNNEQGEDIASTEEYDRGSFLNLIIYLVRFWGFVWIQLPYHLWSKGKYRLFGQALTVQAVSSAILYGAWQINPAATFVVLIFPYLATGVILGTVNFANHIFIDPENPRSNYKLAYDVLKAKTAYNDGFHLAHHVNPLTHWSDLPQHFASHLDVRYANGAFIFQGFSFLQVAFMVMTGQFETLAKNMIQLGHENKTTDELIAAMKERLKPIRPKV